MQSGYLLRDVLDKVGEIHFASSDEIHTLSYLYESLLREMRDAAGESGEFYTPRPLIRMIVQLVDPQPGEVVLDPAAGTGGFLVEAYEHLRPLAKTVEDFDRLQRSTLYGVEAKPLPYLLCQMNLLLHGIDSPQIDPLNALRFRLSEIGDSERVDVILTNPPFGGEEEKGIQQNFPHDRRSAETAVLFLQLIMRRLRRPPHGGRAGMVVPDGTLFGDDSTYTRVKADLLREFNLHTVVRLPPGVFEPYAAIPTNVLFFERGGPTSEIWYYEHPLPDGYKRYTKTKPLRFEEFEPLLAWWSNREAGPHAWRVSAADVCTYDTTGEIVSCDLDVKNPLGGSGLVLDAPDEALAAAISDETGVASLLDRLRSELEALR
jgi:type I restriction enzyme M protein